MNELLITLNSDIKICEETLRTNDYLEIVITLEEILDKYKDKLDGINIENNRVWNYNKKDLEKITNKLRDKRDEIVNDYIYNIKNVDNMVKAIKNNIESNENLPFDKKDKVIKIIEEIYCISKEDINKNLKWDKLKKYLIWATYNELYISMNIIELINLVIKTSK
ncbi:MAG: hypothetical protein RR942_10480 [Romboutsia sp.]